MARYTLILRDQDYAELVRIAGMRRKSMGKLLNEIIRDFIEREKSRAGGLPANPICIVCGRTAVFQGFGEGQQKLYVCSLHQKMVRKLRSYKKLR